jgi:chromosome partitioning protein
VTSGLGWPLTAPTAASGPNESAEGSVVSRETSGSDLCQPRPSALAAPAAPQRQSPPTAAELAALSAADVSALPIARAAQHSVALPPLALPPLVKPRHTRVLVVANQKGGVGKTTTAVNLAACLAQAGLQVLVVDLDPQGNASTALGVEHRDGTTGSYDVLTGERSVDDAREECPAIPGLFVVPATLDLAGAEIELVSLPRRELRLREALDGYLAPNVAGELTCDYVFIDCPPSLGLLTVNALAAGAEVLVPVQCEYYALEGLSQLVKTIDTVREHVNPRLRIGAIVLTMYDGRTRLAAGVADEVRSYFGPVVLPTAIPRSVRISEAPSYGQTVLTYDAQSAGARAYRAAAAELTSQEALQ